MMAKITTHLTTHEDAVETSHKTVAVPMDVRQYTLIEIQTDSSAERVLLELQQQAQGETETAPAPLFVP